MLQGKCTNYDTDLFQPIFRTIAALTGKTYTASEAGEDATSPSGIAGTCARSRRHVADGVVPSNEGRGYVLRRLVRRAIRYGLRSLDAKEPFFHAVVPTVVEVLGEAFPEMKANRAVQLVMRRGGSVPQDPRSRHRPVLERPSPRRRGRDVIERRRPTSSTTPTASPKTSPWSCGARARPAASTWLAGRPREAQRRSPRARAGSSRSSGVDLDATSAKPSTTPQERRLHPLRRRGGRGGSSPDRTIARRGSSSSRTAFYAEAGGQIGDAGFIEAQGGTFEVPGHRHQEDRRRDAHFGVVTDGEPKEGVGALCARGRRTSRRRRANHTATHLLHQALKEELGDHVAQAGSYVGPDRLRFDISHPSGVADEEIQRGGERGQRADRPRTAVVTTVESPRRPRPGGATALFGEKYGDEVRVVSIDDDGGARPPWSLELCGGTHVDRTGQIGPFVIVAERAVAAGVRRLEALTAQGAVSAFQEQRRLLKELSGHLKTAPEELPARVHQLQKQVKDAKKQKKSAAGDQVSAAFKVAKDELEARSGVIAGALDFSDLDRDGVRQLGDRLKGAMPNLAVVLFGRGTPGDDGSGVPFVALCQGGALEKGLKAGGLAAWSRASSGAGGGGRPGVGTGPGGAC